MSDIEEFQIYALYDDELDEEDIDLNDAPPFDLSNRNLRLVAGGIPGKSTSSIFEITAASCGIEWVYLVAISKSGVRSEICVRYLVNRMLRDPINIDGFSHEFPVKTLAPDPTVVWQSGPKAQVTFDKQYKFYNTKETGRVGSYEILYSNQVDANDNLINPSTVVVIDDNVSSSFTRTIQGGDLIPNQTTFKLRNDCLCPQPDDGEDDEKKRLPINNNSELQIYPNPTSSAWFTISLQGNKRISNYKIRSYDGKIVQSGKTDEGSRKWMINLADQPDGLYFVQVTFDDGSQSEKKLIVTRN